MAYVEKRMFLEAEQALVKLNQYGKQSNQPYLYENSLVEAASGQRRKALETVSTMEARWREHLEVDAVDIAAILSELGEKDEALQWLEKDAKDGVDELLTPPFDNVRTEPRFQRVFNRRLALIRDGTAKPSASFWRYGNS